MVIYYGKIGKMSDFEDIKRLKQFGAVPISAGLLRMQYQDYSAPNKKIAQLCKQGLVVRIRRGLYVVSEKIVERMPSRYLLANHICGRPSYVSLETALEYHGMIPEAVYSNESMTVGSPKSFTTPYGRFNYYHLPVNYYALGVCSESNREGISYMIASPEKALCDYLVRVKGLQVRSRNSMQSFLVDFLRMDEEVLAKLDTSLIHACALAGPKKRTLHYLEEAVRWIQLSEV